MSKYLMCSLCDELRPPPLCMWLISENEIWHHHAASFLKQDTDHFRGAWEGDWRWSWCSPPAATPPASPSPLPARPGRLRSPDHNWMDYHDADVEEMVMSKVVMFKMTVLKMVMSKIMLLKMTVMGNLIKGAGRWWRLVLGWLRGEAGGDLHHQRHHLKDQHHHRHYRLQRNRNIDWSDRFPSLEWSRDRGGEVDKHFFIPSQFLSSPSTWSRSSWQITIIIFILISLIWESAYILCYISEE